MTEIVLKPELIKNIQKVLIDYEPANQDPILAAQYLSAIVGSIVATSNLSSDQQEEILKQILDFTNNNVQNLKLKAPPLRSQSRRPLQKLPSSTRPNFRISHHTSQKKMKST